MLRVELAGFGDLVAGEQRGHSLCLHRSIYVGVDRTIAATQRSINRPLTPLCQEAMKTWEKNRIDRTPVEVTGDPRSDLVSDHERARAEEASSHR